LFARLPKRRTAGRFITLHLGKTDTMARFGVRLDVLQ
jgi:hypothetical protein